MSHFNVQTWNIKMLISFWRYKMLLLIISGQTALHTNFYVAFCFMARETSFDYIWILQQFKALYLNLKLPKSTIIVIDMKRDLMQTINIKFFFINHFFCLWHINNNVVANCKRSFDIKKEWKFLLKHVDLYEVIRVPY